MIIRFQSDDLKTLATDEKPGTAEYSVAVVNAYRSRIRFIMDSKDERALRGWKSLHFEKLSGQRSHQHSIRLNKQFRLIFELKSEDEERIVTIVSIEDYH